MASSISLFAALGSAIERSQAELMEAMEMSQKAAEHQADTMLKQLEVEIKALQGRENALCELAQSDDHIHCIKVVDIVMLMQHQT